MVPEFTAAETVSPPSLSGTLEKSVEVDRTKHFLLWGVTRKHNVFSVLPSQVYVEIRSKTQSPDESTSSPSPPT